MIVQIIKCDSVFIDDRCTYWYKDNVGQIFEVEEFEKNWLNIINDCSEYGILIHKEDVKVLSFDKYKSLKNIKQEIEKIEYGDLYSICKCSDEKYSKDWYYCPKCGNLIDTQIQNINIQYKAVVDNIHIEINMSNDKIDMVEK